MAAAWLPLRVGGFLWGICCAGGCGAGRRASLGCHLYTAGDKWALLSLSSPDKEQWRILWGLIHSCQWQQPRDHWVGQEGRKPPEGGKRASDLQAPGAALLMPGRHRAPAAMAGAAASSVGGREPEAEEGAGAVCRHHPAQSLLSVHSGKRECLSTECITSCSCSALALRVPLTGPDWSSSLSFTEFAWAFPIPQTEIVGKWVPADHRSVGVPG